MKRRSVSRAFASLVLVSALSAAADLRAQPAPDALPDNLEGAAPMKKADDKSPEAIVANGVIDLGAKLLQQQSADGNFMLSPASAEQALLMAAAGARGETLKQMQAVLNAKWGELPDAHAAAGSAFAKLKSEGTPPAKEDPDSPQLFELSSSNDLWLQKTFPLDPAFVATLRDRYGAAPTQLDFIASPEAARKQINGAIAGKTHDKIKDLLAAGSIDQATRLILTNAVYFKAPWDAKFAKGQTAPAPFHVSADKTVDAPSMHLRHDLRYGETDKATILELPYLGVAASMVIVLPKSVDGLAALQRDLGDLSKWIDASSLRSRLVNVTLPKFKFESQMSLKDSLSALGMAQAFSDKADFTGMSTAEGLKIGDVVQKTFIAVDEEGTEAAAATAVMMRATGMRMPEAPVDFVVDRPFLFAIRHRETGLLLFVGRVMDPTK